ncbi:hypothetical protein [Halodesulfovibrio marinisediminis]|nr:hypothetical protein [Halodesulfovibrio marinisediminis]
MTEKLQRASEAQGIKLKSCYYCYEPFDADSTLCPVCHHRTPSSLIANRYVLLFGLSILTFVFAFFMSVDEYFHNSHTYNMLSAFFNVVDLLPYVAVSKSIELAGLFFVQLLLVMGCFFYTAGLILQTVHRLTKEKPVCSPIFLFFVAVYITIGHPILFWSFTIESGDERVLAVSLAWGFWVLSYLLLWVSLYSLHTEKKQQDELAITPWNQS